jgi:glycosyltransferase involved in cell wall biosynthesis
LGAEEGKIFRHVYGVDVPGQELIPLSTRKQQILFVGRFVEKKAPYLLLMAFRKVLDALPYTKLAMVGDGPLMPLCQQLVRALQLQENVVFLGSCSHAEILKMMLQDAFLYVQHSITASDGDKEGTPVAIIEACMSGLPVVATRHAGIPDVVRDGETGWLVEELDINQMAEYIIKMVSAPDLAQQMGENAADYARTYFTTSVRLEALRDCLHKVLGA